MKKFFVIALMLFLAQSISAQSFDTTAYRPAGCAGSGAIVNDKTDEVLLRVDEPKYIFIHRIKMEITFQKKGEQIYFKANNGQLYPIQTLSIRWQKVANVDNRYLAGEDFDWTHYGHWLMRRPLKYLVAKL